MTCIFDYATHRKAHIIIYIEYTVRRNNIYQIEIINVTHTRISLNPIVYEYIN